MIRFTLSEDPFGWQRAGQGGGRTFTTKRTRTYEGRVRAACQDVMRRSGDQAYEEPVVMTIIFRLYPPDSWSKKKRAAALAGDIGTTGRFDIDNLAKAILDALNKVAFKDDRLIVRLVLEKVARETVGVDVTVESYIEHRARAEGDRGWTGVRGGPEQEGAGGAKAHPGIEAEELGDPPLR